MKLFLATASADDVSWGAAHGMLDGVLTSPGLFVEEQIDDVRAQLTELCRLFHGPIFASVHAIDAMGAYRDGKELAKISDQIVVQVPLLEDTLGAMRRLRTDGIRVAGTHVFSTTQALLAMRAGASSIVVALDRMDAAGHDALAAVREIRDSFDATHAECDVVALSPASPTQFGACATSGADAAAVSADLCRLLLSHPLTDRGIEHFVGDVARLRYSWLNS